MRIAVFLIVTFAFSWAIAGLLYAQGGFAGAGALAGLYLVAMMFGPAIGALVATFAFDRGAILHSLGMKGAPMPTVILWIALGWLAAILIAALATIAAALIGGIGFGNPAETLSTQIAASLEAQNMSLDDLPMSMDTLVLIQFAVNLPIGILINSVLLTFSEELGWRGWLQPRLMHLGFWPMCLVTGLIWGVWHAPIIAMGYNYPGEPVLGPMLMIVFCVLLTPYAALMAERGLVYAAGAFHGAINAVAGLSLLFLGAREGWQWNGIMGLGGFGILALGCALIYLWRRANPARPIAIRHGAPDT